MGDNELNKFADMIWTNLNCLRNMNKNREEQMEIIKETLIKVASESRDTGRKQILNYMSDEITKLRV